MRAVAEWWKASQEKGGGGFFSGLSLDFLKATPPPPPETDLERNTRLAAEEAERTAEARALFDEIDVAAQALRRLVISRPFLRECL